MKYRYFIKFRLQQRKLDVYFDTEEKLMSKNSLDNSIMDIISNPEGDYYLCCCIELY